ncbi:MAG: non-ribosomal peptide synthetase [Steroidobacteraceae bacterium]
MFNATTLTGLLQANRTVPRAITYLGGESVARTVTFADLHERALGILYRLQRTGIGPGDKLVLLLGENEQFIDAFWAAIMGGIIPVPVAVGSSDEHRQKLFRIAGLLGAPFLYTERRVLDRLAAFAAQSGQSDRFERLRARAFFAEDLEDISRPGEVHAARPEDVALIQFSSGSTSEPKGIVLTHANILANARATTEVAGFTANDVSLSWMPLTHDMGLIGFHLFMFANRVHAHLMPTDLFIRRPLLWLQFASRIRATILCSPNFGYKHYLRVLGDRPIEGLDLSSVRLIFNGAEPISAPLCEQFLERLAPARLARNAMYPVYGLAEASLAVSFPPPGAPLRRIAVNRHRLGVGDAVEQVDPGARESVQLIGEGRSLPHCSVRIADEEDRPLPEDRVGHLHIRGENVTRGYYENPNANAAAFSADGWLRTGDLALMHGGELYLCGRAKEIIFVNGRNHYPHDLEAILQRLEGLELGKVAAAGARRPGEDLERLVLFVLHRGVLEEFVPLAAAAARLVSEQTGLEVAEVVPVKRIPKTTSGKIERYRLAQSYAEGQFDAELKELAALRATLRAAGSATGGQIEAMLKTICESALGGRRVDVHDNLFELGASSLKLIEIHEQIEREYPGQLDLTELFDYPTIAQLAQHLQGKVAAAA